MGMQWQMGSMHLDFSDAELRAAYQPRHALARRRQGPRAGFAEEVGLAAPGTQHHGTQAAAASCRSYDFSPVSMRRRLMDRAAAFVRHPQRHDGGEQVSQQGCA